MQPYVMRALNFLPRLLHYLDKSIRTPTVFRKMRTKIEIKEENNILVSNCCTSRFDASLYTRPHPLVQSFDGFFVSFVSSSNDCFLQVLRCHSLFLKTLFHICPQGLDEVNFRTVGGSLENTEATLIKKFYVCFMHGTIILLKNYNLPENFGANFLRNPQ